MKKEIKEKTVIGKDGEITTIRQRDVQKEHVNYTQVTNRSNRSSTRGSGKSMSDVFVNKKMVIFILVVIFLLVTTLVVVMEMDNNKLKSKAKDVAQRGTIYSSIDGQAPLVASVIDAITSKVSSTVKSVHYQQGQTVRSGAKLLELDTTYAKNEITQLNTALKNMENMLQLYTSKNDNLTVKAQTKGFLTNIKVKQGDNVKVGDVLASYIPTTSFTVIYDVAYDETKKIEKWQKVNVSYEGGKVSGVVYDITGNSVQDAIVKVSVYITDSNVNLSGVKTNAEFVTLNGNVNSSKSAIVDIVPEIPIYAQESGSISRVSTNLGRVINEGTSIMSIRNEDIVNKKKIYESDIAQLKNEISYYNSHELNNYVIYAKTGGVVQTPALNVGDAIIANTEIILIQTDSAIKTEIVVDEEHIDSVKLGQKANIYVNVNGEDKTLDGVVTDINDVTQGYTVEITLNTPAINSDLIGKNAKIGIILEEKKNAIFIKTDLVYGNKIYVLKDKEVQERTVTIGIQNNQYTEIVEGLAEKEIVVEK